jgi:hypothetical protein
MAEIQYQERLSKYVSLQRTSVKIKEFLGDGTDGAVWSTDRDTAIKAFRHEVGYANERDTYQRLAEWGVTQQLAGFWIPELQGFDDDLMVVEMDFMQTPPYVIDFAKVRFSPPDFSDEVISESEARGLERFEGNWPRVKTLLEALESFQIYYLDPTPYNIVFPRS